ncbi:hypothetical protein [Kordiimonas aestuarii]|uniref:hypothetical protein n=1 Tax=Kordiimonas aestuarii TaxID=1005925 RepID=UPI0021D0973B|nr:hypothetical protein [Kordiimonas aestuarii]
MATGSANKRISAAKRPHASAHAATPAAPRSRDLLLFTNAKHRRWSIIGAMSVMTMDWQDF